MGKVYFFIGLLIYGFFFITFLQLAAFVGNLGLYWPSLGPYLINSIDSAHSTPVSWLSLGINLSFLVLFGLQHSLMARIPFKKSLVKHFPEPLERSLYVLLASVILVVMMIYWQPVTTNVWNIENPIAANVLWGISVLGWGIVLFSSFIINHFELFGVRQAYLAFCNRPYEPLPFMVKSFYKLVRHPLYFGFILALWSTPSMSIGHLELAAGLTLYMFIGTYYEEKDLVKRFGEDYKQYQKTTPMVIPFSPK